jgi:hypothetical protein
MSNPSDASQSKYAALEPHDRCLVNREVSALINEMNNGIRPPKIFEGIPQEDMEPVLREFFSDPTQLATLRKVQMETDARVKTGATSSCTRSTFTVSP